MSVDNGDVFGELFFMPEITQPCTVLREFVRKAVSWSKDVGLRSTPSLNAEMPSQPCHSDRTRHRRLPLRDSRRDLQDKEPGKPSVLRVKPARLSSIRHLYCLIPVQQ